MQSISEKIDELSKKREISLVDLAQKVGISRAGLYNMLGSNNFKVDTLEKVADALGVNVSYFFTDEEDQLDSEIKALMLSDILLSTYFSLKKVIHTAEKSEITKQKVIDLLSVVCNEVDAQMSIYTEAIRKNMDSERRELLDDAKKRLTEARAEHEKERRKRGYD